MLVRAFVYTHYSAPRRCLDGILASPNRRSGLHAGRHRKLQRNDDLSLDHAVMLRIVDGRVIAAGATLVVHLYELRFGEYCAVVGAKTLHDGRYTFCVDIGQKPGE